MVATRDSSVPVLLLGTGHHGGLCIARSLGRFGARVYIADSGWLRPAFYSRFCRGRYSWDLQNASAEDSIKYLLRAASEIGGRPILIPTNDFAALFVAEHAELLQQDFTFPAQNSKRSQSLVQKKSLFHLASRFGIPTPYTTAPGSRAEAYEFARTAPFPVMMKADDCGQPGAAAMKHVARTPGELLELYDALSPSEQANVLFQEYIPGGEDAIWMFNGYFDSQSNCLFGMTGQKIRQCPVYTGAACLAVCRHNQTVYETTLRFMKAIGYCGILDIGYRYDARDGSYKVLDVNPRIGSTFRLFTDRAGLDVAQALYLDLTNQSVHPSYRDDGRRWMVEDCDVVSSYRYWRDGNLTFSKWRESFRGVEELCFLSWNDPLPVLPMVVSNLADLVSRIGKKAGWTATPGNDGSKQPPQAEQKRSAEMT